MPIHADGLNIVFAFIVALVLAFAATPLVNKLAYKLGAVDIPRDNRRMHKTPKARLGGLAIFYGFLVSVVCFANFRVAETGMLNWALIGILAGSVIIVVLGMLDDIKPRKALLKFVIQIGAALIPVLLGVRIYAVSNPFDANALLTLPTWLSIAVSVLWIVGVTNAVNLIDGLDGLAVGVSSIAAISLLSILLLEQNASLTLLVLTAALAGSCFGFLPYNFNPAKIFMGDTGSTFLGYILACVSIQGPFKMYVAFAVPLLVLGIPIFDTAFAIIRRIAKGQSPMTPDRGHLHHRLMDAGFSHRTTVVILYGLSAVLAVSGIVLLFSGLSKALILIISVMLFLIVGLNFVNNKNTDAEHSGADSQAGDTKEPEACETEGQLPHEAQCTAKEQPADDK